MGVAVATTGSVASADIKNDPAEAIEDEDVEMEDAHASAESKNKTDRGNMSPEQKMVSVVQQIKEIDEINDVDTPSLSSGADAFRNSFPQDEGDAAMLPETVRTVTERLTHFKNSRECGSKDQVSQKRRKEEPTSGLAASASSGSSS